MKFFILIFILNFYVTASAKDALTCHAFLNDIATEQTEFDITANFIAYLQHLKEINILSTADIEKLINDLKQTDSFSNPLILKLDTQLTSQIHAQNLEAYVEVKHQINKNRLLSWGEDYLKNKKKQEQKKNLTQQSTSSAYVRMQFHPITFLKKRNIFQFYKAPTEQKIEVMSTPVTEMMWLELMGYLPELDSEDTKDVIEINYGGKNVRIRPDYPVVNINWYHAAKFANALSKIKNLPEVYNFNESPIGINAPKEDIYQALGYRLPTEMEQQFLLSGGYIKEKMHPELSLENLGNYAWTRENATLQGEKYPHLQPVAQLQPLKIDGQLFFDLYGNVRELSHELIPNHPDKLGRKHVGCRYSNGGSFYNTKEKIFQPRWYRKAFASECYETMGFRLVRSLPK